MPRDWTDDEIAAEIAKNVKIVAEDRERADYTRLHEKYKQTPENTPPGDGKAPPPPKADGSPGDPPAGPPKPKRSLWWGEAIEDPPEPPKDGSGS